MYLIVVSITLVNSLSTKFSYIGVEQSEEIEKQEYLRTSDELMQLYMRNLAYLRKKEEDQSQKVEKQSQEEIEAEQELTIITPQRAVSPIADDENPFESVLNDEQMALLVECINEVKLFNASVSIEDFKAILACKPNAILKLKNNRNLACFFSGLADRSLITSYWQSVIANNQLFISSQKDSCLNQSDLSSATDNVRGIEVRGKYATIERFLKQAKKL